MEYEALSQELLLITVNSNNTYTAALLIKGWEINTWIVGLKLMRRHYFAFRYDDMSIVIRSLLPMRSSLLLWEQQFS